MSSFILYKAAGQPQYPSSAFGRCRTCGYNKSGIAFNDWIKPTFTNHDLLFPGNIICEACQFAFDESSELLASKVGKDKPQRMRNYSHIVHNDQWYPLSKAQKTQMYDLLLKDPQIAIIAISGQKHLIFRSIFGWWQIEENAYRPFKEDLIYLYKIVDQLYEIFSKEEILSNTYKQHRIIKFGVDKWHSLESKLTKWRTTIEFQLAVFLVQKEIVND